MGPRAGLDRCGKSRPPPGFDPWTVQPVASRYTDYATRPTLTSYGEYSTDISVVMFFFCLQVKISHCFYKYGLTDAFIIVSSAKIAEHLCQVIFWIV